MVAPKTSHVQFNFSKEAESRIDNIKAKTGASSRAEVIRRALRLYDYVIDRTLDGEIMAFEKDGEFKRAVIL